VRNSGSKRNVNKSLVDKFIKNNLPPKILWPDLVGIDNLSYEKRLNCASELLDKAITEGLGEKVAIYGSTGGVTYQELLSQANQIAHVLSDDAGILPGSRVLIRSSNNINHSIVKITIARGHVDN